MVSQLFELPSKESYSQAQKKARNVLALRAYRFKSFSVLSVSFLLSRYPSVDFSLKYIQWYGAVF